MLSKSAAAAARTLGALALLPLAIAAGSAAAQQATSGKHPNDVWDGEDYVNAKPILTADLDLGGSGAFTAVIDPKTDQLCYMLNTPGLDDVTAAHIHKGGPGENGAPVVPLSAPTGGSSGGCVAVKADIVQAMLANPGGYYVNVHTKALPAGADRGQLHKWDGYRKIG